MYAQICYDYMVTVNRKLYSYPKTITHTILIKYMIIDYRWL